MRQRLYWPTHQTVPAGVDQSLMTGGMNGVTALQVAIQILEPLTDSPECRFLLARCYQDSAGKSARQENSVAVRRAIEILQTLVDDFPDVTEYRFALCVAWTSLEIKPSVRSDITIATIAEQLGDAQTSIQKLVRQHPNEPACHLLQARIALKLASVPLHPRDPVETQSRYEAAKRIHDDLAALFPESLPCQIARITCLNQFARHLNRVGKHSKAREYAEECMNALEELENAGTPAYLLQKLLAECQRQLSPTDANGTE